MPDARHGIVKPRAGSVLYDVREQIACITLAAPPLNILSAAMMSCLAEALLRAQADGSLKGVAVTAVGKAFSAGAEIREHTADLAPGMIREFSRLFDVVGAVELPLVMAVHGPALGAGFELVTMADVLLAEERAAFGQPEIRLGCFAPLGVSWLGTRVGWARAAEITATGRTYSAAEMHALGLVTRVVPPGGLDAALEEVLDDLRRASPVTMRMNMRLLRAGRQAHFAHTRQEAERVFVDELLATEDALEGINAFTEKRDPAWKNR